MRGAAMTGRCKVGQCAGVGGSSAAFDPGPAGAGYSGRRSPGPIVRGAQRRFDRLQLVPDPGEARGQRRGLQTP